MKKYSFKNDYSEGCHPSILTALAERNLEQYNGYGEDAYSQEAIALIRKRINNLEADVHFVSGGTQANLIVIAAILRPHESVISAVTGHIHIHEAGAIEATGHKIEALPTTDGKLRPFDILTVLGKFEEVHMARPRLVYISNSTEIGTHYTRQELIDLSACCRENDLWLFMDGARLASALCAADNDLTFNDLALYTDVFYIGGTKSGALLGEAIVINHKALQKDFVYHLKQRGALMAKGRLLGIQFLTLFKNDLYFELAVHANKMAAKISKAAEDLGLELLTLSATNQIFPILPKPAISKLQEHFEFYTWHQVDEQTAAIRIVTSWATKEEVVDAFIEKLRNILEH